MKQYGPMSLEDSQENAKLLKKKNYNPTFINCREEQDWSNNASTFALSIESYLMLFYSKVAQLT